MRTNKNARTAGVFISATRASRADDRRHTALATASSWLTHGHYLGCSEHVPLQGLGLIFWKLA